MPKQFAITTGREGRAEIFLTLSPADALLVAQRILNHMTSKGANTVEIVLRATVEEIEAD